jgi:hypothetical protein
MIVTARKSVDIESRHSGKTSATVVVQVSFPSSMSVASTVAVIAFVLDPSWNRSLSATGVVELERRTPAMPRAITVSARNTIAPIAGMLCCRRTESIQVSSDSTFDCGGAALAISAKAASAHKPRYFAYFIRG